LTCVSLITGASFCYVEPVVIDYALGLIDLVSLFHRRYLKIRIFFLYEYQLLNNDREITIRNLFQKMKLFKNSPFPYYPKCSPPN